MLRDKKYLFNCLCALMFLLVLEACKISVDKQPTQTADISVAVSTKQEMIVSPSLTAIPSKTVTLSPSVTPTQTPSATLLPSSTPTLSPTLEPSDTPTLSPTPSPTVTPAGFQRGIYAAAGCIQVTLTKYMWVDWCVINVEINRDQSMVFNVTWKAYTPHRKIIKRSDKNNPDMYLTDNLGNHYSFIGLSGGAGEDVLLLHDETYRGAFIFPPALPGADTFSFHDSDNGLTIDNLHLDKPYIAIYDFVFQYNGLALEYPDNKWIVKKDENGKPFLNYLLLENCHFREAETSQPTGKYKNTIDIGAFTFEIYGWLEDQWGMREYLAVVGPEDYNLQSKPMFVVRTPFENSLQCLNEVSTLLNDLRPQEPR